MSEINVTILCNVAFNYIHSAPLLPRCTSRFPESSIDSSRRIMFYEIYIQEWV